MIDRGVFGSSMIGTSKLAAELRGDHGVEGRDDVRAEAGVAVGTLHLGDRQGLLVRADLCGCGQGLC